MLETTLHRTVSVTKTNGGNLEILTTHSPSCLCPQAFKMFLKNTVLGCWKDGSVVDRISWSCWGPKLNPQSLRQGAHNHLQLQLQGTWHLLLDSAGNWTPVQTHTYAHAHAHTCARTHMHTCTRQQTSLKIWKCIFCCCCCSAKDRTENLKHARRVFYHWATVPVQASQFSVTGGTLEVPFIPTDLCGHDTCCPFSVEFDVIPLLLFFSKEIPKGHLGRQRIP